jgi:uncharacterized delta-60 repeat protein
MYIRNIVPLIFLLSSMLVCAKKLDLDIVKNRKLVRGMPQARQGVQAEAAGPAIVPPAMVHQDMNFEIYGQVITSFFLEKSTQAYALVIQPDGKLIAGGDTKNRDDETSFALARYNPDGTLDQNFGGGGVGPKPGTVTSPFRRGGSFLRALQLQQDGKIVAGGISRGHDGYYFLLARYNQDGSFDSTFGDHGYVITHFGIRGVANSALAGMQLQPDGKIVAVGNVEIKPGEANPLGARSYICVARYLENGDLDPSFGLQGKVVLRGLMLLPIERPATYTAHAVAIDHEGRLLIAGKVRYKNKSEFVLIRRRPDGGVDSSFGTLGVARTNFAGGNDYATALAVQPDGTILVAGQAEQDGKKHFAVARYLSNGTLDHSFNQNGKKIIPFEDMGSDDCVHAVLVQPDGKIVVAGAVSYNNYYTIGLARLNPDGSFDNSFGSLGKVDDTIIFDLIDGARALVRQSDGKLVVAGSAFYEQEWRYYFTLVRYTADGELDRPIEEEPDDETDDELEQDDAQEADVQAQ